MCALQISSAAILVAAAVYARSIRRARQALKWASRKLAAMPAGRTAGADKHLYDVCEPV